MAVESNHRDQQNCQSTITWQLLLVAFFVLFGACDNFDFYTILNGASGESLEIMQTSAVLPIDMQYSFSAEGGLSPYIYSIVSGAGTINADGGEAAEAEPNGAWDPNSGNFGWGWVAEAAVQKKLPVSADSDDRGANWVYRVNEIVEHIYRGYFNTLTRFHTSQGVCGFRSLLR